MKLRITSHKEYNNEANLRSQRDAILAKLNELGFVASWTILEE